MLTIEFWENIVSIPSGLIKDGGEAATMGVDGGLNPVVGALGGAIDAGGAAVDAAGAGDANGAAVGAAGAIDVDWGAKTSALMAVDVQSTLVG